jgi:threonine/homoserine/homoserine lactone efflux protein
MLRWLGAAYLLWLAWQALKPGAGGSPFEPRSLAADSPLKLFAMGFFTNALNPKIAVFYLSVFPQFVRPDYGSVFAQSLQLGLVQIMVSFCVNLALILSAARLAAWFAKNPLWLAVQRLTMGFVLTGLAVRLALEERRN